jgi:SAM-dependent methyltransferase
MWGGRNHNSQSNRRLRKLSDNPDSKIVSTDILPDYNPDIVDDICNSRIGENSYDAIYCDAILEHVQDYEDAIYNMHRILKKGGELFVYVPFFYCFHDKMDYHRFTFTEVDRMLKCFSKHFIFLPDSYGYGGVLSEVLSFYLIDKVPFLRYSLSKLVNFLLGIFLGLKYMVSLIMHKDSSQCEFREYRFFYTHFYINHGFCAWAIK